jgi:hypothetical protein
MFLRYCDVTPESRNEPLLDIASVNTFSRLRSQQWGLRCKLASPQTQIPAATDTLVKVKALPRIDTRFRGKEY